MITGRREDKMKLPKKVKLEFCLLVIIFLKTAETAATETATNGANKDKEVEL